ncbi:MAG: Hsp33 family molecular chaperone HslO [Clostridiales bacterium]|nr:Hsp33 family molecular chaperone HslO [Clostridiales bacterium]
MGMLKRAISADASVVSSVIDATDIVSEIERIHTTSAVVTAALGRLSIAASLMGYGLKGKNDSITLRIDGKGPTGALVAVSNSSGDVKSYVCNPIVELPLNQYGKLDVAGAVGKDGILSVVKDLGLKEPYIGQIPIVSGEIAEDVASYYAISEQIPTVCGLGVLVNPDLTVKSAGGYLVQLLPFADEKTIDILEENIKKIPPVSKMFDIGMTAEEISLKLLEGLNPNGLDEAKVAYKCDCSRKRTEKVLISLGEKEIMEIAKDKEITEVCCHFCEKKYKFSPQELLNLLK